MKYITYRPYPIDIKDRNYNYSQIDWSGNSFLVNPELLLSSSYKNTKKDIAHYIGLASLRSYPEYKATKKLSLDLLACIGMEDIINNNSLLYIKDNQVHFLYEEATKEKQNGA